MLFWFTFVSCLNVAIAGFCVVVSFNMKNNYSNKKALIHIFTVVTLILTNAALILMDVRLGKSIVPNLFLVLLWSSELALNTYNYGIRGS